MLRHTLSIATLVASFPALSLADDILLSAPVTSATIHPSGATIQRQVAFSAAAGSHQLILSDLPENTPLETVRVSLRGATLGTVTLRDQDLLPRDLPETAALKAARAEVVRLEDEIAALRDKQQVILLPVAAAHSIASYLGQLGQTGEDAHDVETLRQTARMIGEETHAARQAALEAQTAADALNRDLQQLAEDLAKAQETAKALHGDDPAYVGLTASIQSDTAIDGLLTLDYMIGEARWLPVYDIHLTRGDDAGLILKRGAYVLQDSGEDWAGVTLNLSTSEPLSATQPGQLYPRRRRITDPEPTIAYSERPASLAMTAPMVEPVIVEEYRASSFTTDGISVIYSYPKPIDIASGADKLRLALGELSIPTEVIAHAVPQLDDTAFVMAAFTNTSDEIILPTDAAFFYLDGQFTGQHDINLIAGGAKAELSFGPIQGLRVRDIVVSRNEGDRGVLSKSSERSESRRFEIDNLTASNWDMRIRGQVPYSEQEDLVIDWQAKPMPQTTNVDDQRGILEWRMQIGAGQTKQIRLDHLISWPDGKVLQ